jgi:hypothetical protein
MVAFRNKRARASDPRLMVRKEASQVHLWRNELRAYSQSKQSGLNIFTRFQ